MKSNQQWINRGKKSQARNFDAKKLDPIQRDLLAMGIPTIREETIHDERFTQARHERTPDLTFTGTKPRILLEHDTVRVHGELGFENEKTLKRNRDFARAKIPFAVINADLCDVLGLDESAVAAYMHYHTLMLLNAGAQ